MGAEEREGERERKGERGGSMQMYILTEGIIYNDASLLRTYFSIYIYIYT